MTFISYMYVFHQFICYNVSRMVQSNERKKRFNWKLRGDLCFEIYYSRFWWCFTASPSYFLKSGWCVSQHLRVSWRIVPGWSRIKKIKQWWNVSSQWRTNFDQGFILRGFDGFLIGTSSVHPPISPTTKNIVFWKEKKIENHWWCLKNHSNILLKE